MSATKSKVLICPYCGDTQAAGERCRVCGGLFEPLSRQASHNGMGPWFLRDERRPFQPGASYETIVKLIERGQVTKYSIIRSPTTRQFWTVARRVPGIAHLLGYCHNCDATVGKDDHGCPACGVPFGAYLDRNYLGLPEVKPLPWEAPTAEDAHPRAIAPGPLVDFRRAAEPLGLSSFASDDELRGMAARPAYMPPSSSAGSTALADLPARYADEPRMNGGGHAASLVTFPPTPGAARRDTAIAPADHAADSPVARAMQRRVQQQAQQIRWLMALLGAIALAAAITIGAIIIRTNADKVSDASGASDPAPQGGAEASERGKGAPPISAQPPLDHALPATQPVVDDLTAPAAQAEGQPSIQGDYDRALELLVEARKEDRPLKDRIRDVEAAAGLLKSIRAGANGAEPPAGLDQQILDADKLLERLRLEEFFP